MGLLFSLSRMLVVFVQGTGDLRYIMEVKLLRQRCVRLRGVRMEVCC